MKEIGKVAIIFSKNVKSGGEKFEPWNGECSSVFKGFGFEVKRVRKVRLSEIIRICLKQF